MGLTSEFIEQLLFEEESASLDFKQEQYKFDQATDFEKSELLKDILAFANAFRRDDAFILTGVEEVKGGRSIPKGIAHDLDDAKLQQFVNGKTNRTVDFSYQVVNVEGIRLGVFHILLQPRPLYLKKDYGKLRQNVVYLRRGSSTSDATPEEIARMGVTAPPAMSIPAPKLLLEFESSGDVFETSVASPTAFDDEEIEKAIEVYRKQYTKQLSLPAQPSKSVPPTSELHKILHEISLSASEEFARATEYLRPNIERYNTYVDSKIEKYRDYLRQDHEYRNQWVGIVTLNFLLVNSGTAPADDIDIWLHIPDGVDVLEEDDLALQPKEPDPPVAFELFKIGLHEGLFFNHASYDLRNLDLPHLRSTLPPPNVGNPRIRRTNSFEIDVHIRRVKHHNSEYLKPIYLSAENETQTVEIDYTITAANMPNKIEGRLYLKISSS